MSSSIQQLRPDLTIGQENPQREKGSRILNAWMAERKLKEASANVSTSGRNKHKRNYAAAVPNRMNTGWGGTPTPADWHIWQGLQSLRSRSREQYRNNDYARRFIAMCKSNIVGPQGIIMQSKVADLDGQPDKLAQDAIESTWREWSRYCDAAGRLTLTEMCRLIIATVAVDGECLVRQISSGPYGFQLKLIDPELLDIRFNETRPNGVRIHMGVELDKHGKHLAYYLLDAPDDVYRSSYYTGKHTRVPADEMLHLFLPEMIDQTRGVPWMASALVRMKNLHGYEEAAVIAARIGASKMGFFTTAEGDGADPLADDETLEGEFIQDAEPGIFEVLPDGYDFRQFNPDYPHQQFGDFIKATLRGISSGLGVAYNGLANDLEGVNYSSIRAGVLEEREQWKGLQTWLIDSFMRPVFESWLDTQLAIGTLKVPSKEGIMKPLPADRFDKFRQVSFQPRRWAWVDPQKDMNANAKGIELMLKSRSEIIRDLGRDPDEVWAEIARENIALEKLGISPEEADLKMKSMMKQVDYEMSQELADA